MDDGRHHHQKHAKWSSHFYLAVLHVRNLICKENENARNAPLPILVFLLPVENITWINQSGHFGISVQKIIPSVLHILIFHRS